MASEAPVAGTSTGTSPSTNTNTVPIITVDINDSPTPTPTSATTNINNHGHAHTDTKDKTILVNGFMFCSEHGDEYCHLCGCDHRMSNNVKIEEELEDVVEFLDGEVEVRHPINAYAHGALPAVLSTHDAAYECERHRTIDCPACFNWVEAIKKEAEDAEEHGRWMGKRESWKAMQMGEGEMEVLRAVEGVGVGGSAER
ncbi:hypothetical protein AX16_011032 [Volvariella volvacea WC 439]|nr:hypothetical protein AX16_011032 [Volvariella volvacea WC 439]